MDVKECYQKIGGDYEDVMSRLRTNERVKKFLIKVAEDKNYDLLLRSLEDHNMEEAFRAAHTLKGICLNLSLTRLFISISALTEALRGKTEYDVGVEPLVQIVIEDYAEMVDGISALD